MPEYFALFVKEIDFDILKLLQSGDESGLEKMFHLFYKPLVIYAQQYLVKLEDAEDLVQDVFVRFWESKSYTDIQTNLRAYLYQSVKNASLNKVKQESKYQFDTIDVAPEISTGLFPDDADWSDYIGEIYAKIDLLPPRTKAIFVSIVLEDQKYKDVADQMHISVNTVKTSLSRALQTLRSHLSKGANLVLSILIL